MKKNNSKLLILVLFCTVISVADANAERLLAQRSGISAYVSDEFKCSEVVPLVIRAESEDVFLGERVELQRLLGGLRLIMGFECSDTSSFVVTGKVVDRDVYTGIISKDDDWQLVTLLDPKSLGEEKVRKEEAERKTVELKRQQEDEQKRKEEERIQKLAAHDKEIKKKRVSCTPRTDSAGFISLTLGAEEDAVDSLMNNNISVQNALAEALPILVLGVDEVPEAYDALAHRILKEMQVWKSTNIAADKKPFREWNETALILHDNCLFDFYDYVVANVVLGYADVVNALLLKQDEVVEILEFMMKPGGLVETTLIKKAATDGYASFSLAAIERVKKKEEERIAKEKVEKERLVKAKVEQERIAVLEKERIANEKAEQERIADQIAEDKRAAVARKGQLKLAQESAEKSSKKRAQKNRDDGIPSAIFDSKHLTDDMAKRAITKWLWGEASVTEIVGIHEIPDKGTAEVELNFKNFRYKRRINPFGGSNKPKARTYSGLGEATFIHYNDGEWGLKKIVVPDPDRIENRTSWVIKKRIDTSPFTKAELEKIGN